MEYPKTIEETFKDRSIRNTVSQATLDAKSLDPQFPDTARFRKVKWITHESDIPWLVLDTPEFDWEACYQEAMAVRHEAVQHRPNDYDENDPDDYGHRGWSSLTLHGLAKDVSQHWDSKDVIAKGYNFKDDLEARAAYHWTEIADKCPKTVEMIKSIPGYMSFDRVRFMYLEPGGYITPHIDGNHNRLGPVNVALNNPVGCEFKMIQDNAYVPWKPGRTIKLNVGHTHSVMNDSDELRVHMIVHGVYGGKDYEDIILKSWAKTENNG
jgi:hypothetical protein